MPLRDLHVPGLCRIALWIVRRGGAELTMLFQRSSRREDSTPTGLWIL
jgi:hypothetical protein